jgi:hypothetical protein
VGDGGANHRAGEDLLGRFVQGLRRGGQVQPPAGREGRVQTVARVDRDPSDERSGMISKIVVFSR